MKKPGISPDLLQKYLSGQCTGAEKEQVEAWYNALEGETRYLDHLPDAEQEAIQTETFDQIRNELQLGRRRVFHINWYKWVAAACLLVGFGLYFNYYNGRKQTAPVAAKAFEKFDENELISFENTEFKMRSHYLPDSSEVTLQPHSVITYPRRFDDQNRLVTFSGEGFFNVKKDPSRPFLIRSGDMTIRVLGTSFNVKAAARTKTFQVDVLTGSVEVTAAGKAKAAQQVVLKPQQQAIFELTSGKLFSKNMAANARKAIYEPVTIVFEETPLKKVIDQLEKRFDAQIILSNPGLGTCGVTGNFESQPLNVILEMLCTALEADYSLSSNKITINGPPCE